MRRTDFSGTNHALPRTAWPPPAEAYVLCYEGAGCGWQAVQQGGVRLTHPAERGDKHPAACGFFGASRAWVVGKLGRRQARGQACFPRRHAS